MAKIYGDMEIRTNKKLKLFESSGTNFASLRSASSMAADLELELPAVDGTAGQVLVTDASGVLSFATRVTGPGSATDNTLPRFDATTGALLQSSGIVVDDSDNMSGVVALAAETIAASVALTLKETGAGSDLITLQSPAALAASYSLTLPIDAGSAGELLSTNGSGVLSWSAPSTVSSFKSTWTTADTDTKVINHALNSTDVIVQILDITTGETISVDTVIRTDADNVTVTASEAPPAGSWRVLILAV